MAATKGFKNFKTPTKVQSSKPSIGRRLKQAPVAKPSKGKVAY